MLNIRLTFPVEGRHADDAPCAFQLGGSNPLELAQAAKLVEQAGYQESISIVAALVIACRSVALERA